MREAVAERYDLLLGRCTYDMFASSFANTDSNDPTATKTNKARKFVVSSDPTLPWQNSEQISGDIPAAISRLKEQGGPLLQVHGSWQLVQTLLAHQLIDEFRLWTFPSNPKFAPIMVIATTRKVQHAFFYAQNAAFLVLLSNSFTAIGKRSLPPLMKSGASAPACKPQPVAHIEAQQHDIYCTHGKFQYLHGVETCVKCSGLRFE